MSSDLDKLMGKLHKPKVEDLQKEEEIDEIEEIDEDLDEDLDNEEDEDEEDEETTPIVAKKPKNVEKNPELKEKIPAQNENIENSVEAEVGFLQNNGIFRRELIITLKELVDIQKIQAEILIQLNKRLKK